MLVFHATTTDGAKAILRGGFRDSPEHSFGPAGVWLSDTPVDENEGTHGGDVQLVQLVCDVPEHVLREFENVEDDHPNRIFVVPSTVLAHWPIREATEEECEAAKRNRWERLFPDTPWRPEAERPPD